MGGQVRVTPFSVVPWQTVTAYSCALWLSSRILSLLGALGSIRRTVVSSTHEVNCRSTQQVDSSSNTLFTVILSTVHTRVRPNLVDPGFTPSLTIAVAGKIGFQQMRHRWHAGGSMIWNRLITWRI